MKIGRNDPCPCGSDKKYKKCCMGQARAQTQASGQIQGLDLAPPLGGGDLGSVPSHSSDREPMTVKNLAGLPIQELSQFFPPGVFQTGLQRLKKTSPSQLTYSLLLHPEEEMFYFSADLNGRIQPEGHSFALSVDSKGTLYGSSAFDLKAFPTVFLFHLLISNQESQDPELKRIYKTTEFSGLREVLQSRFGMSATPLELTGLCLIKDRPTYSQMREEGRYTSVREASDTFYKLNLKAGPFREEGGWEDRLTFRLIGDEAEALHKLLLSDEMDYAFTFFGAAASLRLVFSDGSSIGFPQLLFHPYTLLLKKEELPNLKRVSQQGGYPHAPWIASQRHYRSSKDHLSPVLLDTTLQIAKFHHEKDFQLLLMEDSWDDKVRRPGVDIKKLTLIAAKDLQWKLEMKNSKSGIPKAQLRVSFEHHEKESSSWVTFSEQLLYCTDSRTLYMHSIRKILDEMVIKVGFLNWTQINLSEDYSIHCEVSGVQSITLLDEELRRRTRMQGGLYQGPPFNEILSKDLSFQVHLQSDNPDHYGITCEFQTKKGTHQFSGMHSLGAAFFAGLKGGLGDFFPETNSKLALQQKGEKRRADLRLLKHRGLFLALAGEWIAYQNLISSHDQISVIKLKDWMSGVVELFSGAILDKSPESKTEVLDWLESSSLLSILTQESAEGIQFSDEVLKRVQRLKSFRAKKTSKPYSNKFTRAVHFFSDTSLERLNENPFVLLKEGEFYRLPIDRRYLQWIFQLIVLELQTEGPDVFFKGQSRKYLQAIDIEPDFDERVSKNKLSFHYRHAFPTFLRFQSAEIEVMVNGSPLANLPLHALKTQLALSENYEQGIDWFDLHPKVFFESKELSEEEIQNTFRYMEDRILEYKGRFYLIPKSDLTPLHWLNYFWERITQARKGKSATKSSKRFHELPRSQVLEVLALRKAGVEVSGGEQWEKVCEAFDQLNQGEGLKPLKAGKRFVGTLKSYQSEGHGWLRKLYDLKMGGILADDMGLGKTIQALAFLDQLREEGELGRTMIVVPTSLIYNWISEAKRFTPDLNLEIFETNAETEKSNTVYLITYGLLLRNQESLSNEKWNVVFFDEAQNLKNLSSKRTDAARKLPANSKFCLTGTPMENHYLEFYSLVDLVLPGALGSYESFSKTYRMNSKGVDGGRVRSEDIDFLKMKVRPLLLRRRKDEILHELPAKQETMVELRFEKKQERIYRDIAISWNKRIQALIEEEGEDKAQIHMLTALLRLRQACTTPQMISNVSYSEVAPKISQLLSSIEELHSEGESALVFANFKTSLDLIEKELQERGLPVLKITGDTPLRKRKKILESFETSSGPQFLLMTMKTGGVGLNLVKARYVFHLDPWWNPAVENQATDRAHRIGQTRSVQVYRYVMHGSVEEKIMTLKGHKAAAFEQLLDTEDSLVKDAKAFRSSRLTRKDFEFLLS
jgi:superfamily II DNA or RNA helicase